MQNRRPQHTPQRGRGGQTSTNQCHGNERQYQSSRPPPAPTGYTPYPHWATYASPPSPFPAQPDWAYPWNYGPHQPISDRTA